MTDGGCGMAGKKMTMEPASEAAAEHAALKKMGKKTNADKHVAPKFGGKAYGKK